MLPIDRANHLPLRKAAPFGAPFSFSVAFTDAGEAGTSDDREMAVRQTPYGSVEEVYVGGDLEAWWIVKEDEEIEPGPAVMDREDLLYVAEGSLRLELEGREPVVLRAGELIVIPAATPFRGYRWPRDGDEPCRFLAVAPAGASFTRL